MAYTQPTKNAAENIQPIVLPLHSIEMATISDIDSMTDDAIEHYLYQLQQREPLSEHSSK